MKKYGKFAALIAVVLGAMVWLATSGSADSKSYYKTISELGKMGDVAKHGRTIMFVSHNMAAVQSMCGRAIWLEEGKVVDEGAVGGVVSNYLKHSFSSLAEQVWPDPSTAPGTDQVRLRSARVYPESGLPSEPITIRTPFALEFEYWNLKPGMHLNLSLHVYNEQGIIAFNAAPINEPVWHGRPFPAGLFRSVCHVPGDLLNDGLYRVQLLVVRDEGAILHIENDVLMFDVRDSVEMRSDWHGRWVGVVRPNLDWQTELLSAS